MGPSHRFLPSVLSIAVLLGSLSAPNLAAAKKRSGRIKTQQRVSRTQGIAYLAGQFCEAAIAQQSKDEPNAPVEMDACLDDAGDSIGASLGEDACEEHGMDLRRLSVCGGYLHDEFLQISEAVERTTLSQDDVALIERISTACSEAELCDR